MINKESNVETYLVPMPPSDIEAHTFIGEQDPYWGKPLLGIIPYISGVDLSDTNKEAYSEYKSVLLSLEKKRFEKSNLKRLW